MQLRAALHRDCAQRRARRARIVGVAIDELSSRNARVDRVAEMAKVRGGERILVLEEEPHGDVTAGSEQLAQTDEVIGVRMRENHDVERAVVESEGIEQIPESR